MNIPRPSGLALGALCPGSFNMSFNIRELLPQDNSAAERGTLIHALAAAKLGGGLEHLEDEHRGIVEGYINLLKEITPVGVSVTVEETLDLSVITTGMVGTPDAYFVDFNKREVHVFDLKTGFKFVSEYENLQLLVYAMGVVEAYELNDFHIHLHIYQPAHFPAHRVEVLSWLDFQYQIDWVLHIVNEMLNPNAITRAGLHCGYCPAAHECKTFEESAERMIEYSREQRSSQLNNDALNIELILLDQARRRIEDRETVLKAVAEHRMQQGQRFKNWSLEPGRGSRKWRQDVTELDIAKLANDHDKTAYLMKLKTPPQLEKEGIDVKQYCELTPGKATIKPINTKLLTRKFK